MRNNRCFFAKDLVKVELERGKAEFYANKYMVACKFRALQDKSGNKQKVVYMLSTCHATTIVDTGKKAHPGGNPIMNPAIISSCNSHMGGVDRVDQQLHGVQTLRRAYKWYKKLAFRIILQCTLNAHKAYVYFTGNSNFTYGQFHEYLN